ncbi:heavy metal-associated isoprenylated plant protein 22-like [Gastrolobium bilobum]|uniref:heavy metal-associated isoprenylated plant protein 22-like n=1 Tax=Gastrolobium bilobum TaxID=150636 RepID=UPI002AB0D19B|nr:heavy metal-associated isoprenylated plant protein 22-like [Gastrolobium bilobum]
MGFLDHLPQCFTASSPKKKFMPKQTVDIWVKMDCEGCARKVKKAVEDLEGVESVEVNQKQQRVTVTGYIDPNEVLEEVQNTGKTADIWSFDPYNSVTYPYVDGAYDIEAPIGFVRNVPQAMEDPKSPEMKLMVLFNDDNPNACSIM